VDYQKKSSSTLVVLFGTAHAKNYRTIQQILETLIVGLGLHQPIDGSIYENTQLIKELRIPVAPAGIKPTGGIASTGS
jgi:hypothetical protein